MSEVSNNVGNGPEQPSDAPLASCATIRSAPGLRTAAGQPVYRHDPRWTAIAFTVTVLPVLFAMRIVPPSYSQAATGKQPSNVVCGEPAHGVGKLAASARRLSA